jgi:tetratricopeptide (TPR) repeat protein
MLLMALLAMLSATLSAQSDRLSGATDAQIEQRLYQEGMTRLQSHRYDEAASIFQNLEREVPRSPLGFTGEGITLALLHREAEAISALQKAIGIDPQCWIARRELGMIEWQLGDKGEAAAQLTTVAQAVPDDAGISAVLAEYSFSKGQYAQAANRFGAAPAQVAASPRLALMNAEALIRSGRANRGIAQLRRISVSPNLSAQDHFRIAWLLGEAGDYAAAIAAFRELPKNLPDPLGRDYGLALAYYEDGQYDACVHLLDSLPNAEAQHAEIFSLRGAAAEAAGHPDAAWQAFRAGIAVFPQEADNYLNAATIAVQQPDYTNALQVLAAGLQRIPGDYRLWQTRGVVYTLTGNFLKAETDYRMALILASKEPSPWVALGICYMDQNKNQLAAQTFRQAIASGLSDVRLNYYLTDALFRDGITAGSAAWQQAMDLADSSIRLDPNFPFSFYQRSRLWIMKGDTARAIADLERAHQLDPESSSITYQLALAERNTGNRAEASALLSQVSHAVAKEDDDYRHTALMSVMAASPARGFTP